MAPACGVLTKRHQAQAQHPRLAAREPQLVLGLVPIFGHRSSKSMIIFIELIWLPAKTI
jgi:hypothetical protein